MNKEEFINQIRQEYNIVKKLSEKNDSQVYLIKHKQLDKKLILRFSDVAIPLYSLLKTITFENLPTVFEVYSLSDCQTIIEEYIDGITVGEALESGTFNYDGAKKIIIDICDALEVLHTNGFVHRDIKPENIIISNNGTVKLIDFNASRINKPIASKDTTVLGTIGYAAPEQFGISQTDARADIYSLGILLNVLLTGHHPSDKIVNGLAKSIVLKCTQIDPNKRYQTVKQLRRAL